MFSRSGIFKTLTSLPVELGELPLEPLLEVSYCDASAQNQDIIALSPNSILEEQQEQPAQPDEILTLHSNANMAEAGKIAISPSKFYGDGNKDVEKWIRYFERISTGKQWNEALLRDRAADFWEGLPVDTQKSYNQIKEALLQHFLPPEARCMYYTDLYNQIQRERGPVADFARAILDMTRRVHSTMSAASQGILCSEHFLHQLCPNLKKTCFVQQPQVIHRCCFCCKTRKV